MLTLGRKFANAIFTNTAWVFFTIALFISYLMIQADAPNSIGSYLYNFLLIIFLFSPILLFATFRNGLKKRLSTSLYSALWGFCFIIYPIFLIKIAGSSSWSNFQNSEVIVSLRPSRFLLAVSFTLFITEIVLLFNDHLLKWIKHKKWLQRISLEKGILGLCLFLSVMLSIVGIMELWETPDHSGIGFLFLQLFRFLSFTIQFFLIQLAYYFFYYCNHYLLIPKVLKGKGVVYYGFSVAALILVCYPVMIGLIQLLPVIRDLSIGIFAGNLHLFAKDGGGLPFMIMILSVPIIISNQWFKQHSAIAILEKEKTESELDMLKQQINPHFFFNTLNNLYALSLTNDKATPGVILQLSELMRYVIYKGKERAVALQEEVKYIEDYVRLQQLRRHQQFDYSFEKQIGDEQVTVPPLLFIILVENAFKHGIEPAEHKSYLQLCLETQGNQLTFTCINSIDRKKVTEKGIGLDNLRRRLDLIFPDRYQLQLQETPASFKAVLKINFS